MKVRRLAALPFFLVLMVTATLHAEVIVDNLDQATRNDFGPIGDDATGHDFLIGQEFTLPAGATPFHLDRITLLLNPLHGSGNITASIWNISTNNNPINEIAVVSSQAVVSVGAVAFVPSNNIVLPPGTYYVVAAPTTPADSGFIDWAFSNTTNWIGAGILGGYADKIPGSWENYAITDYPEQMSVEAMPVPATLGISRLGGGATVFWPANLNGYVVESTTNLAPAVWQAVTNAPAIVAGNNTLTNGGLPARFFRLRQGLAVDNLDQPSADWAGPLGSDADSNDFLIGQEFTLPTGNYALNQISLLLNPVYGAARVTVSLWGVGPDHNPTNEIAVVASQLVTVEGRVNFVPAEPITVPAGSYFVVAAPASSADNARVGWELTFSLTWTGFGTLGNFADTSPGSWENFPVGQGPYQMSVQTMPVPP